jgi:hypothetical protein
MVTVNVAVTKYFCSMDPSIQFLLVSDVPAPEVATIHSIVPSPSVQIDDDKIGFTLDVAMRLDQEHPVDDTTSGVIVRIVEDPPEELADSA